MWTWGEVFHAILDRSMVSMYLGNIFNTSGGYEIFSVIIGDATTYRTKRGLGLLILGKSGLSGVAVGVLEVPVL
jgi:hypothetical protein